MIIYRKKGNDSVKKRSLEMEEYEFVNKIIKKHLVLIILINKGLMVDKNSWSFSLLKKKKSKGNETRIRNTKEEEDIFE